MSKAVFETIAVEHMIMMDKSVRMSAIHAVGRHPGCCGLEVGGGPPGPGKSIVIILSPSMSLIRLENQILVILFILNHGWKIAELAVGDCAVHEDGKIAERSSGNKAENLIFKTLF